MTPAGTPNMLLTSILNNYLPMITGPEDLDQVVPLLEDRGGEFCGCVQITPELVAMSCAAGFLPMSQSFSRYEILLIKSHLRRSIHDLRPFHVSKSEVRRARGTTLRFSHATTECLAYTVRAHEEQWLTDPLCDALLQLAEQPRSGVRFVSVELYRGATMIAGEIGYLCGTVYTSMSGFYHESGAGKVQLLALGIALRKAGCTVWDLGMPFAYKSELGTLELDRSSFLERYRSHSRECANPLAGGDAYELLRTERTTQHSSR